MAFEKKIDTDVMREFFDKILAFKNTDVKETVEYFEGEGEGHFISFRYINEETIIEKLESKIQLENEFCDVTLACDDKTIWPHKTISQGNPHEVESSDAKPLEDEGQEIVNLGQIGHNYEHGFRNLENEAQFKNKIPRYEIETKFSCYQCPKKLKGKARLKIHIQSQTFSCNQCQNKFDKKARLKIHIHSHEYSSNCKLCSKIFLKSRRSEFQLLIEAIKDQPLCEMKNKILNLEDNHQNYIYQVF